MSRLGHRKSRNGCVKCRQRKVKCDEKRPCSACERHGIPCSLMEEESDTALVPSRPVTNPLPQPSKVSKPRDPAIAIRMNIGTLLSRCDGDDRTDPLPYIPVPYVEFTEIQGAGGEDWRNDLELMHHFTAFAWKTLPQSHELVDVWQMKIPQMANHYAFLMHQLLAFSATHYAFLHPEVATTYSLRASMHQGRAIRGMQAMLSQLNNENCHALFAASSVLCISAFANFARQPDSPKRPPNIDDLTEVFILVRGMNEILRTHVKTVAGGPIGAMLRTGKIASSTTFLTSILQELDAFEVSLEADGRVRDLCLEGAKTLGKWIRYATVTTDVPETRTAMTWAIGLPTDFIELLRSRNPEATEVLKFYCRVLKSAGHEFWILQGWADGIMEDISKHSP